MILKGWTSFLAKIILFILLEVSFIFFFMGYLKKNEMMNKVFSRGEGKYFSDQTSLIYGLLGIIISYIVLRFIQNFRLYKDKYSRIISEMYFIGFFILIIGMSTLALPLAWNTDIEFRGGLAMVYGLCIIVFTLIVSFCRLIFQIKNKTNISNIN